MAFIPAQAPDDKRANVNNRKPRVYASLKPGPAPSQYSIEFIMWLQNNFDEAIAMNEQMKNCNHQWVPEYMVENPILTRVRCRCGAVMTPAEVR